MELSFDSSLRPLVQLKDLSSEKPPWIILPSTPSPSLTPVLGYSVCCRATARCLQLLYLLRCRSWGPGQCHIGQHMVNQCQISKLQIPTLAVIIQRTRCPPPSFLLKTPPVLQEGSIGTAIIRVQWLLPPSMTLFSSVDRVLLHQIQPDVGTLSGPKPKLTSSRVSTGHPRGQQGTESNSSWERILVWS